MQIFSYVHWITDSRQNTYQILYWETLRYLTPHKLGSFSNSFDFEISILILFLFSLSLFAPYSTELKESKATISTFLRFWQRLTLISHASNKCSIIYSWTWVTMYLLESRQNCYSVLTYCFLFPKTVSKCNLIWMQSK